MPGERVGYPTQKPLALLDRIIRVSSNEGDVVLDPFCGCATTLVAADRLQRQWVGIDLSEKAGELVIDRIKTDQGGLFEEIHVRGNIPKRTDLGPPLTAAEKREHKTTLYGLQTGLCNGCNEHFRIENFTWTISSPAPEAAQTTVGTFNCSAATATASRAKRRKRSSPRLSAKRGKTFRGYKRPAQLKV